MVGPVGIDMYLPAFPAITEAFSTDPDRVGLSLVSYVLALSLGQAIWGPVADRWGRRRPLVGGLVLCFAAALLATRATTIEQLTVLRFLQGFGACAAVVIARSIARDIGHGVALARLIATMAVIQGVSPLFGPLAGSAVLAFASWRAIFALAGLLALTACVLALTVLPETLRAGQRPDALRLAFSRYGSLVRDRHFMLVAAAGGSATAAFFTFLAGTPHLLMGERGMAPPVFSLYFGINAAVMVAAAQVSARLLVRYRPVAIVGSATLSSVLSMAVLIALAADGDSGTPTVVVLLSLGLGAHGMLPPILVMRGLANYAHAAGTATAMMGTTQYACAAMASALVGVLSADATTMAMMMAAFTAAAGMLFVASERCFDPSR